MVDDLKTALKSKARELGFAAVGVAPAVPFEAAERAIRERVDSGRLKDYGFARRPAESFTRPDLLLPGAKSIIVAALPYDASETEKVDDTPRGRIARFARGRDYHDRVEGLLHELAELIVERVGNARYRICVDTGPIIDRAAARKAGIGSYGKNASIITREAGSWVVLGEIITDVDIPPDDPAPMEDCGDCTICLRSCPSGAIACPFVIDQTRCISHLTQMKGSIPPELRPLIGDRIYGCDVCQEVCPKNRTAGVQSDRVGDQNAQLHPHPELIPLVNISENDFQRVIGPTAMHWVGRTRFLRNVIIALGNTGDASAVPELTRALEDPDPVIREHAQWAIERISAD